MRLARFTLRDVAFLAVMAALLFVCGAVAMPLMTVTLFGLRNMAMALFYGLFATLALIRVPKAGALTLLGFFNAAILLMMSPIMFAANAASALMAEGVALAIFRGYGNPRAAAAAAGLMVPMGLPFTALFTALINGVRLGEVVGGSPLVALTCVGTVILSFTGTALGRKIGAELRKAGKL